MQPYRKDTIHRLNASGLIPSPLRIGYRPRWRREEIETWLKAGCPAPKEWEQIRR
jgi:predicted DNA-binding transcriptional regulator AlpA